MIDIIVVAYNAGPLLDRCLASIRRNTSELEYSLTVIDNASSDLSSARVDGMRRRGTRVVRLKRNLGFAGGANHALRLTSGEFVVFLDDDAEVTSGWLAALLRRIRASSSIGIVGPKILLPGNRLFSADFSVRPFGRLGVGEKDLGQRDYVKTCEALSGTCWLMRRRVYEKIGGFDEAFFPSQYEDIDYCLRARKEGFRILYDGAVTVIHRHLDRKGSAAQAFGNSERFLRKWGKAMASFPLRDADGRDKAMARGETVLKRRFGRMLRLYGDHGSLWETSPDFLYRAVGYAEAGRTKKAMEQVQQMSRFYPKNRLLDEYLWGRFLATRS